jgi:hypothetical protein
MKLKITTRLVSRALSVVVMAALISPVLPVKQAEASASMSTQNQSPVISFGGSTIGLNTFLGQIFNLDKWLDTKNGNSNKPDKDKPDQDKPEQDKPDQNKPDKDKPDQDKPDKDKPDQDKPDKDKPDQDSKKEYEAITKEATKQLINLRNESKSELLSIAIQAKSTKDAKARASLYQQGQNTFSEKEAQFNGIVNNVSSKLQAKGLSTDIVNQYKAEFNQDVALGKSLLKNLTK